MNNEFEYLIDQLINFVGLEDINKDEKGGISFVADERLIINIGIDEDENAAVFFCKIGAVYPESQPLLLKQLLGANLFWVGAAGSTLSLIPDTSEVMIAKRNSLTHLEFNEFASSLEAFMDAAFAWKDVIEQEQSDTTDIATHDHLTTNFIRI